jgi:hypothetical protein
MPPIVAPLTRTKLTALAAATPQSMDHKEQPDTHYPATKKPAKKPRKKPPTTAKAT